MLRLKEIGPTLRMQRSERSERIGRIGRNGRTRRSEQKLCLLKSRWMLQLEGTELTELTGQTLRSGRIEQKPRSVQMLKLLRKQGVHRGQLLVI